MFWEKKMQASLDRWCDMIYFEILQISPMNYKMLILINTNFSISKIKNQKDKDIELNYF